MKRFKNILVKVNEMQSPETDVAVLRSIELANKTGAKIIFFDVVEPHESFLSTYADIFSPTELSEFIIAQRLNQLKYLAQNLQSDGLEISAQVSKGKVFIEVVKAVIMNKCDLLIKVANTSEKSFDSSDFHIMRKCPQPVWLIKENQPMGVKKILAAVDLSMEQHAEGRAQNRMIMDIATSLSEFKEAQLTIFSCWRLYGEETLRHGAFTRISPEEVDALLKKEEQEHQKSFDSLVKEYEHSNLHQVLTKGTPKTLIPEYVNSHDFDTVVMGTIGRSGIPGLLIGNTSETVLQSINSSVITLKPADFLSPIQGI
ncbi:universal stress protein [Teredinibacter franksiae]|jgi:Universal stress protein UspA and related nucleotide-binding proteins|uniref:universal stress protein n=1 Tax=Teredinibacter franksiae TaxID=2761453 RepID=UPI0016285C45|nr:universal stress protein [Teredinibacter franksiae]